MRHDVDSLKEEPYVGKAGTFPGINSTYYFRKSSFSRTKLIRAIADMGHEVGFHYEVLDEAKGNYDLAINLFKEELGRLRQIVKVETACMHGNPLTRWLNRDLWKHFDIGDMGLKGEAYLSVKDVFYLSDTGRIWDMSRKLKDMLPFALPVEMIGNERVVTTDDVIRIVKTAGVPRFYLTIHPERWSYNMATWLIDQTRDTGMNAAKQVLRKIHPPS